MLSNQKSSEQSGNNEDIIFAWSWALYSNVICFVLIFLILSILSGPISSWFIRIIDIKSLVYAISFRQNDINFVNLDCTINKSFLKCTITYSLDVVKIIMSDIGKNWKLKFTSSCIAIISSLIYINPVLFIFRSVSEFVLDLLRVSLFLVITRCRVTLSWLCSRTEILRRRATAC